MSAHRIADDLALEHDGYCAGTYCAACGCCAHCVGDCGCEVVTTPGARCKGPGCECEGP